MERKLDLVLFCNDGLDNDGDGLIDANDMGCDDGLDFSEHDMTSTCMNGLDDDNDGWLDLQDPDCFVDGDETSTAIFLSGCTDGVDNDGDGSIDNLTSTVLCFRQHGSASIGSVVTT